MTFLYLLYWSLKCNRRSNYPEMLPCNYYTEDLPFSVLFPLTDPLCFLHWLSDKASQHLPNKRLAFQPQGLLCQRQERYVPSSPGDWVLLIHSKTERKKKRNSKGLFFAKGTLTVCFSSLRTEGPNDVLVRFSGLTSQLLGTLNVAQGSGGQQSSYLTSPNCLPFLVLVTYLSPSLQTWKKAVPGIYEHSRMSGMSTWS